MAGSLPEPVFRLIVERTKAPFVVIDGRGDVVYASAAVSKVLDRAADQVVGRNMVDFLEPDDVAFALESLAELNTTDRAADGIPIVLAVRLPGGGKRRVEIAALSLFDAPGVELIALRIRSFEAQHRRNEFVSALLDGRSPAAVLEPLAWSIVESFDAVAASVHYGFDGVAFEGVVGTWPGAEGLPLAGGPWAAAVGGDDVVEIVPDADILRSTAAVAGWLLPVAPRDGTAPAVVSMWRNRPGTPLLGHSRAFIEAADLVRLALVRTAEHQRLVHLARHDPLTGAANRSTFRDHLAAALAAGQQGLAVGFCDLDGFKQVNDLHGHGTGDDLLIEVTRRIRSSLRADDELARAGGDEFTILWRGITDEHLAGRLGERVLLAADQPFDVPGGTAAVGLSLGIAIADHGATAESLLALADAALYESKQSGGRCLTIRRFSPS